MIKKDMSVEEVIKDQLFALLDQSDDHEYMSEDVLEAFKVALVAWKESLIKESSKTIEYLKEHNLAASDVSDQATQEETFSLYLKERDRSRNLLKKIDESLELIETADYGFCTACSVEIGYDRLLARMTATMCIDCKAAEEIKERHRSSS
jgi:DnaK suppressor protein